MRKLLLFLSLASCDPVEAEDPPGRCDPTKDFAAALRIDELSDEVASDQDARLSDDEKLLVFAREWPELTGKLDLYWSARSSVDAKWSAPSLVGFEALNGDNQERAPSLADGGLTLYYASYLASGYDILVSTRPTLDASWGAPSPVAGINSPTANDRDAWFLADGSAVYFASERAGGYSLYRGERLAGGGYGQVTRLAELDGPDGTAFTPIVSADELTIYFSSERSDIAPLGAADIYRATRTRKSEPFGRPVNLSGLNTVATDVATWVSPDDCEMILRSERPDNTHRSDLFVARRPR